MKKSKGGGFSELQEGQPRPHQGGAADSPEGEQEEGRRVQGCQRLPESDRPHQRGQHADREH